MDTDYKALTFDVKSGFAKINNNKITKLTNYW